MPDGVPKVMCTTAGGLDGSALAATIGEEACAITQGQLQLNRNRSLVPFAGNRSARRGKLSR